jgi:hypothetical protein
MPTERWRKGKEMYNVSNSKMAHGLREKFDGMKAAGGRQAKAFFSQLQDEVPRDFVVATDNLDFDIKDNRVVVQTGDNEWFLHRNAMNQMVSKTGILTGRVADKMFDAHSKFDDTVDPWGRELLLHNLKTMYSKTSRERVLMRVVQTSTDRIIGSTGEVRGFLSDRYRRLDTGPILLAFSESALDIGAVPIVNNSNYTSTYYHDTKVGFSMFVDEVFEPIQNEAMIIGLVVQSSDFGAAALTMNLVMLRIQCTNMMITQNELRQVHLGTRLPDNIEFSAETYRKDTEATASAVRDAVKDLMGPEKINAKMEIIRSMGETKVDPKEVFSDLRRKGLLIKKDAEKLVEVYNEPDVELMPAGNTAWRAAQAISLFANRLDDTGEKEKAVDIRHAAGAYFDKFAEKVAS